MKRPSITAFHSDNTTPVFVRPLVDLAQESGEPMQNKTSSALTVCPGLIGFVVLIAVFGSGCGDMSTSPSPSSPSPSSPSSSSPSASSAPETPTPPAKPEPGSQWDYSTNEDTMGRKQSFAIVESTNTLTFGFPYEGRQWGMLTIRRSARWGTNVLVRIERGQFLCGIEDCTVNVRFDSGPIQSFSAVEPADHSTTELFLHNEARFISQLRRAKVVRVETTFYQEGSQTLEFNVEGFKWPL